MANATANAMHARPTGIHSGASIHHQLQSMTPLNFSVRNTTSSIPPRSKLHPDFSSDILPSFTNATVA